MMKILEKLNVRLLIPGGRLKPPEYLISNLAGVTPAKPTYATLPLPGIQPLLVDENGKYVPGTDAAIDGVYSLMKIPLQQAEV